jgi:hypothetical protein
MSLVRKQVRWTAPPAAGGRHRWILTAALQLTRQGVTPAEVHRIIEADLVSAGRAPQRGEIEGAIAKARRTIGTSPASYTSPARAPVWPDVDPRMIAAAAASKACVASLWELSPFRFDAPSPAEIMALLFAPDALLCVGTGEGDSRGPVVARHADLAPGIRSGRFRYVVPNPMSAASGVTTEGRPSPRAKSNVGPRVHAVVEWDAPDLDLDQQAARLWFLAQVSTFPLRLAMLSGGKSLHGWFAVGGADDLAVHKLYRNAARLGADICGFKSPHQWYRIPDACRENGNLQTAVFVNPPAR